MFTDATNAEVEEYAQKIVDAVNAKDWEAIGDMIQYPIGSEEDNSLCNNKEEFLAYANSTGFLSRNCEDRYILLAEMTRVDNNIQLATEDDREQLLKLYKEQHGREFCPWNENYPSNETIDFDLSRDALFVMKENDEIIAAISSVVHSPPASTPTRNPTVRRFSAVSFKRHSSSAFLTPTSIV